MGEVIITVIVIFVYFSIARVVYKLTLGWSVIEVLENELAKNWRGVIKTETIESVLYRDKTSIKIMAYFWPIQVLAFIWSILVVDLYSIIKKIIDV